MTINEKIALILDRNVGPWRLDIRSPYLEGIGYLKITHATEVNTRNPEGGGAALASNPTASVVVSFKPPLTNRSYLVECSVQGSGSFDVFWQTGMKTATTLHFAALGAIQSIDFVWQPQDVTPFFVQFIITHTSTEATSEVWNFYGCEFTATE